MQVRNSGIRIETKNTKLPASESDRVIVSPKGTGPETYCGTITHDLNVEILIGTGVHCAVLEVG